MQCNIYICFKYAEVCVEEVTHCHFPVDYVVVVQLTVQLNCIFFFRFDLLTQPLFLSRSPCCANHRCAFGISWGTGLQNEAASYVLSLSVEVWSAVLVH